MRVLRIILLVLLLVIVVIAVGGFVVFNQWTRGPLPQVDGEIAVAGLTDSVDVLRDHWGIPHIYAKNTHDLFFAQGYTQAQDRWWQMEFSRHIGSGRIEELTGKNAKVLASDVFIRKAGWRQAAERDLKSYDAESVAVLQAFADGVNAYITSRDKSALALEYNVLGLNGVNITVEPWTPVDSLVWAKVMAWNLSGNMDNELLRSKLYDTVGQQMTDEYAPTFPFGKKPTILRDEDLPISDASASAQPSIANGVIGADTTLIHDMSDSAIALLHHDSSVGSNNWVVSGSMTQSGKPLLANDPHLDIQMPSIWYEIGLHCQPVSDACPYEVTGFALPATPGVVIGHDANIAWGLTNVGPDTQDLYKLKINPDNPLQYEWNGKWRDMTVRDEEIHFGNAKPAVKIQVRETHLGAIINDHEIDDATGEPKGFNNDDPMALHWTATDPNTPSTILEAVLGLDRAKDWTDFRNAARLWDVPAQNMIYADTQGNTGYQTPGNIPIRAAGETGLIPSTCASDDCTWKGFIPFDDLPRIYNPKRGYIDTANQAVVPPDYYAQLKQKLGDQFGADSNYFISQEWDYGYRGQRITDLLEKNAPHTIATFQAIQGDDTNLSAEELLPYLAKLDFGDPDLDDARDWLGKWDFQMTMDSPQAALYAEFWARLIDNLYNDQLPENDKADGGSQHMWATLLLMDEPDDAWWNDVRTKDVVEKRDDILIRSFKEAYAATVKALGADRDKWKWGSLHTATFVSNPLGLSGISLIEGMVNRGPVAVNGGAAEVNATNWDASSGGFAVQSLPSMRMIVDLGDLTQSVTMHTTGESGHPYSPHYSDMIDSWRNIQYHPMLWSRDQVEQAAADKLTLKPKQ
jgi:penicillin amidase